MSQKKGVVAQMPCGGKFGRGGSLHPPAHLNGGLIPPQAGPDKRTCVQPVPRRARERSPSPTPPAQSWFGQQAQKLLPPFSFLVAGLLLIHATAAEDRTPSGRIFYVPFEDSLDATEARGDGRGERIGNPTFTAGRKGKGLLVGDVGGCAAVSYPTRDNFSLERGAVAMWVQPVNWTGDDPLFHTFFRVKLGEKGDFLLYKYCNPSWGLTFFIDPDRTPRSKLPCYQSIKEWRSGEWRHIACTWTDREGIALYIDGEQVRHSAGVDLPKTALKPQMTFGGGWQLKGSQTVIDELMVFSRMLAPHEIAMLAGKAGEPSAAETPRDIPGVMLAHAMLGQRVLAQVYRDALGEPFAETARLTLNAKGTEKALATKTVSLSRPLTPLDLDLKPFPKGEYEARLALMSGDTTRAVESLRVQKETDDTWDTISQIGKEDTVLPPFTPLTVAGKQVSCYGRDVEFGESGLPTRVRSRERDLLAGPIRVIAAGPDRSMEFAPDKLQAGAPSPTQVKLSGLLRSESLDVETTALARYDGTVWTTLRFHPRAALELKILRIEIPVAAEQARYLAYIAPSRIDEKRWGYDALPGGDGVVWRREFLPSAWLGTEDRGIGWYAESDEHWDIDGEEALTVERRDGAAVLSMNILRKPRLVEKDFTIEFGIQATPVRPLSPDWRSYQWAPSVDITKFLLHLRKRPYPRPETVGQRPRGRVCFLYAWHSHFTSTLPKDPEEFREMVERAKGYGLLTIPYTDVHFFPENSGDFWEKGRLMRTEPIVETIAYSVVCNAAVCHRGPYADWFLWYVQHLVREYGINGIYLDEMTPSGCANAEHGCGYVGPDGKRRMVYPLRAWNETFRRIRTVLASTGKPFCIAYHISGSRVSPLATFGDCLLLGEDLYSRVAKDPDYTVHTTAAQWRAGYAPGAWGIPVVLLPQFKMNAEWMKSADMAARLMAVAVPHDLMVWSSFADTDTIMRIRGALERFGIGEPDTTFLPYWATGTGVTAADSRLKVSAYLRPGKLLLCAANWSGDDIRDATIRVDGALLKLPKGASAHDAVTGEPVPIDQAGVRLSVPAKRLRLVVILEAP